MKKNQFPIDGWLLHVLLGTFVIAMGLLLNINSDGRVAFKLWPNVMIPELCFSQKYFGSSCPICGMTRSVISIAHGRWKDAFTYHWMGPLVFSMIAFQIPYGLQLRFAKSPWVPSRSVVQIGWWMLIASLLMSWTV